MENLFKKHPLYNIFAKKSSIKVEKIKKNGGDLAERWKLSTYTTFLQKDWFHTCIFQADMVIWIFVILMRTNWLENLLEGSFCLTLSLTCIAKILFIVSSLDNSKMLFRYFLDDPEAISSWFTRWRCTVWFFSNATKRNLIASRFGAAKNFLRSNWKLFICSFVRCKKIDSQSHIFAGIEIGKIEYIWEKLTDFHDFSSFFL